MRIGLPYGAPRTPDARWCGVHGLGLLGRICTLGAAPPLGAVQTSELLQEIQDVLPVRDNEACHHHGNHGNENRLP